MPSRRLLAVFAALLLSIGVDPLAGRLDAQRGQIPLNVLARMATFNQALGVTCTHCHVDGKWTDEVKPQFAIARNMMQMVLAVNERLEKPNRVTCSTCHRGEVKPSRQPRPLLDAELEKWPAELASAADGLKTTMSVYNVALGVKCEHCHVADWKSPEKPAMKLVRTMNGFFEIFPKFMPATARTQCYTCHKGSVRPPERQ